MYKGVSMVDNRDKLIPSTDLADFYARKISTCLSLIYTYWDTASNNKRLIININKELHEIFKMIKSRLKRFSKEDLIKEYEYLNEQLIKLIPLKKEATKDKSSGDRIVKIVATKQYHLFKTLVDKKESIIWGCLDTLGLLGKIEVKEKRLR